MSEIITASLTVSGGDTITVNLNTLARGPAGTGGGGSNSVTSATTSDGTADLSLLNVTTATATVSGTLTASHIHGNLAGSVYAHVRAGEALLKGDPVYVSGFNNGTSTAEVSKADASNAAKMPAIGIMDANLAHNATGHMVITGTITDVNTAGYSINAELYVAAGGGMTATPPTARAQPVARVERVNANNGAIIVKVNGLSASDATPSTLVRRDASGAAEFVGLTVTGGTTFGDESLVQFDAVEYEYGAGAEAAHRTALGSGATGDPLFTAATPAAALTTLGGGTAATGTGAVVLATSPTFAGQIVVAAGAAAAPSIVFDGATNTGIYRYFSSVGVSVSGSVKYWFGLNRFEIYNDSISLGGSVDLVLNRDAANTLGQRNGTNAQVTRIYDTYTSASDYHRLAIATARATATAMSGASVTLTNIIPAGAVVVGVTCKVTTAITGATSFQLGTAADPDRFGAAIAIALGTTSDNRNWTSGTVECFLSATSLVLTADGSNFTGGAVYVSVQYLSGQAD